VVAGSRARELETATRLEWLETDGYGGYASSTVACANTRRQHGLLVVARRPPADRFVLLSRMEETLVTVEGERFELGTNFYPGAVHPHGHVRIEEFRLDPWPIWRYRIGPLTLVRELFFAREVGALVLSYVIEGGPARLELRPLVAGRAADALVQANHEIAPRAEVAVDHVVHRPYPGVPPLVLSFRAGAWSDTGEWFWQTVYPRDAEQGRDDREDLYSPGVLAASLTPGEQWVVACGVAPVDTALAHAWARAERLRREIVAARGRALAGADPAVGDTAARLALAAEDFLVKRNGGLTIIAGYPFSADWGRDAMVALPGILLATGRLREAASVLRTFAAEMRDGLIPNRFPDDGGRVPLSHYNSADASLWFVEAVAAFADAGGDATEFLPAVLEILDAYRLGTHFGIGMAGDGLIQQGQEGVQLTWMDAMVEEWVVTPRVGKAVEINALWYNALRRAGRLVRAAGADADPLDALADRVATAFEDFWNPREGCLYDVIDGMDRPDAAIRPNQILAVSLPFSPLSAERARSVVDVVERELLIPQGLRTLACGHPAYIGRFAGSERERAAAYHCGTAWPWLLGSFATAYRRVHGDSPASRARVRAILDAVDEQFHDYGLGHIAEVVAGDPPHEPAGCFAQAWSAGELLRLIGLLGDRKPAGVDAPIVAPAPPAL